MKNLQATHEGKLRNAARSLSITTVVVAIGISVQLLLSGVPNTTLTIVGMALIGFGILSGALRIILLYLADQSLVIDRQTQQFASIEKRLEDTRKTVKQVSANSYEQREKV